MHMANHLEVFAKISLSICICYMHDPMQNLNSNLYLSEEVQPATKFKGNSPQTCLQF